VGATDDAVEDDAVEDDVCTGEDAPAAQTARDESECDVLDSIYLDGSDEFFDCIEHGDLNWNDDSNASDKENISNQHWPLFFG